MPSHSNIIEWDDRTHIPTDAAHPEVALPHRFGASDLIDEFRDEARRQVDGLDAALLLLEENGSLSDDARAEVARHLHTLKGNSAMIGLNPIVDAVHDLESVFRSKRQDWPQELLDSLFETAAVLRRAIDRAGTPEQADAFARLAATRLPVEHAADPGLDTERDTDLYPAEGVGLTGKASDGTTSSGVESEDAADATADDRSGSMARSGADSEDAPADSAGDRVSSTARSADDRVKEDASAASAGHHSSSTASSDDDRLESDAPSISADDSSSSTARPDGDRVGDAPATSADDRSGSTARSDDDRLEVEASTSGEVLRVPFAKLDELLATVGELVTVESSLADLINRNRDALELAGLRRDLADLHEALDATAESLRAATMELRLVPIRRIFQRFPTLARDIAREQDKRVRVILEGGDVELDKSTTDALAEPLLHLVRNAVDHGIDAPEDREAAGKPPIGVIRLSASQRGDQVEVEVADDGSGLDHDKIIARARELGLLQAGEVPAHHELEQLIFSPGFSTRRSATTVSGRGVGLDVVMNRMNELRGSLSVRSRAGEGTTFTLRLPLTLAIVPSVLFESAGEVFALPTVEISEMLRGVQPERAGAAEVIRVRDEMVPIARPAQLFGWESAGEVANGSPESAPAFALVIRHDERSAAVLSERIVDHRDLVIKALPPYLRAHRSLGGASVLPDQRVALLLDATNLLDLNFRSYQRAKSGRSTE